MSCQSSVCNLSSVITCVKIYVHTEAVLFNLLQLAQDPRNGKGKNPTASPNLFMPQMNLFHAATMQSENMAEQISRLARRLPRASIAAQVFQFGEKSLERMV
jgi:hypothetical protein